MSCSFYLDLPCCIVNICFEHFEDEYIDFFKKIYSAYLSNITPSRKHICSAVLKKNKNRFTVAGKTALNAEQDIENLYNIIHYIVCDSICRSCDEQGFVVLHASSFILNEKSVLLAGKKSSGKTTALLYFLMNGAIYTGDEVVVISSDGIMPYQLPLRAKINTITFLKKQFNYEFKYHTLPFGINTKKQYLSSDNSFRSKTIENWIKCDKIVFLNENYSRNSLKSLTQFEDVNSLLQCVRNKTPISSVLSLIKEANICSTDFSVSLDEVKSSIYE